MAETNNEPAKKWFLPGGMPSGPQKGGRFEEVKEGGRKLKKVVLLIESYAQQEG
jgi:hypothetical protein